MADTKIPSFIKVDPHALALLAQGAGIQEQPPIERKGADYLLHQEKWDQWISRNKTSFKWPSFVQLFKAQGNDDDADSLSVEDLQLTTVSDPKRARAEMAFVKDQGYPEAVIMDNGRQILRMSSGQFWVGKKEGKNYTFKQISRQEGRTIESRNANEVLENLAMRFNMASPTQRLYMKSTMGQSRSATISSGGGGVHRFADKNYRLGNSNAKIAYKPGGEVDRYFLYQPQNGCVAAAILNGAIFSGTGITKNPKLLTKFYTKLKIMQGSTDGRIDIDFLVDSISEGEIPGLTARQVNTDEVEGFVNAGRPVVAIVPYFSGHAFLITEVNAEEHYYKAVDTVSGMLVQDYFHSQDAETKTVAEPIDNSGMDGTTKTLLQPDATQKTFKLYLPLEPIIDEYMASYNTLLVLMGGGVVIGAYSFEVKDAEKFLAWLKS